jgi:1-acyl-sn-glycerol-3-phosphate acyltransferase
MVQKLSDLILRLFGWKLIGGRPDVDKYVAICAPHTSNFDALWFFLAMMALKERPKILIKSAYYRFPIKRAFLAVGGVPVVRGIGAKNMAGQLAKYIDSVDRGALMLAPEGSRSFQKFWKVGFYQIADATNLPIYFAYADYAKKELGIHPIPLMISGDVAQDMEVIREFYSQISGKYPDQFGPIRLKRE